MNFRLLVGTLFFGGFVANMNAFALGPFLSPIADDIGSTVPLVGQASTLAMLTGAVLGLLLGPVSDHYGIRRLLVVAAVLMAISGVGTALAFDYWSLVLTRIPAGISAGMVLGLGVSVVNTRVPEEGRRSAIAWIVSSGALAAIFGVPLLSILADLTSWRAGFWIVGILGVLLGPAYFRSISPDPPVPEEPLRPFGVFRTYRKILSDARMVALQSGNLLWSVVWIGGLTYYGAYMVDMMDFSLSAVGYVFMLGGTCFFLGNRSTAYLTRYWAPQTIMVLAGVILCLAIIVTFAISTGTIVFAIAIGVVGASGGVGLPVVTIMISEVRSSAPGSVMMLRQFTWGMGSALGAASGGALIGLGGYPMLGLGLAGFAVLSALAVLVATRIHPAEQPQPAIGSE